jgi:hypothetical protein
VLISGNKFITFKLTLGKTEAANNNQQSRDTGNTGYKKLNKGEQNKNHNTMTKPGADPGGGGRPPKIGKNMIFFA